MAIRVISQNNLFEKENFQNNRCFKIMLKLVCACYITKTIIDDYVFKIFNIVKIIVGDYDFFL